jgi:hypothetical protein
MELEHGLQVGAALVIVIHAVTQRGNSPCIESKQFFAFQKSVQYHDYSDDDQNMD